MTEIERSKETDRDKGTERQTEIERGKETDRPTGKQTHRG